MRILLVDDDPIFLELIGNQLNMIGRFDITRAESGSEAIDIVLSQKVPFDCFLLDIDMPGMDGIELCSILRGQPAASGVPIIMVTRLREIEMMEQAFAAGASDYLNKPLVPAELRGRLQMAQAKLAEKRSRLSLMEAILSDAPLKLSDPTVPDGVPCCIDFMALENYAFRMGSDELCRRTVLGLQISNVAELYGSKDAASFKAVLNELAAVIVEAFGIPDMMLSYAGNGQFIALLGDDVRLDMRKTARTLSDLITLYVTRGRATGEIAPKIKMGHPVSPTLFSCASPDEVLQIAMGIARDTGTDVSCSTWPSLAQYHEGDYAGSEHAPVVH